ncbi:MULTISPECIES: hypothetical protein [Streptomyces]|nr:MULTISPECIES: hypothetical protein [Streptomyces]
MRAWDDARILPTSITAYPAGSSDEETTGGRIIDKPSIRLVIMW